MNSNSEQQPTIVYTDPKSPQYEYRKDKVPNWTTCVYVTFALIFVAILILFAFYIVAFEKIVDEEEKFEVIQREVEATTEEPTKSLFKALNSQTITVYDDSTSGAVFTFSQMEMDMFGDFNQYSGAYTAPAHGLYYFHFQYIVQMFMENDYMYMDYASKISLYRNGEVILSDEQVVNDDYLDAYDNGPTTTEAAPWSQLVSTHGAATLVELDADDQVTLGLDFMVFDQITADDVDEVTRYFQLQVQYFQGFLI